MSLFTEVMVSVYLYLLRCLTDLTGQAEKLRESVALMLVCVIALSVFVNLFIFVKLGIFRCKACIEYRARMRKYFMEEERKMDEGGGVKLPEQPWHIDANH